MEARANSMSKVYASAASIALVLCAPLGALAGTSDSTTGDLTGTIIRPILVTANQDMRFGTIVRPSSGSGSATLSNAGALTVTGTGAIALPSSVTQAAMFTVSGEGGQAFTLTIDSSVTLTNAAASGGTLTVSTTNDAGCTASCTLSGVLGATASGTLLFHVGGSLAILSTTNSGAYSGTINVLVTYN